MPKTTVYYYVTATNKKVVQEFIDSLEKTQQAKVIRMIKTIGEYVENEEILGMVADINLTYAQGYHVGLPAPQLVMGEKHSLC